MEYNSMPKNDELEVKPVTDTQDSITGQEEEEEE